jgi:hypothetical protein
MKQDTEKLTFRTLRADEIELRVGIVSANGASLLLYKDARCDQSVLDETVGPLNWQRRHSRENANCTVDIWDSEKGIWVSKEDTGTESNTEKEKGLASDSFKRACTNWGIGRELYSSPFIFIKVPTQKKQNGRGYELVDPYVFSGARVSNIEYDANRRISALSIVDADGVVKYTYPRTSKPQTQSKSKVAPKIKELTPLDMVTAEDAKKLKDALEATNSDVAKFLAHVSSKVGHPVESVDGMTYDEYDVAVAAVNKKMERKGEK